MTKTETEARHTLVLEDRKRMTLGGVSEVRSFSENTVSLKTVCGELLIQGKGLNISRLNTDTGELFVSGEISLMKYSAEKKKGNRLEGLFR